MTNNAIDYSKMYRLPFSKNDNFNGWIEITTKCNIKCPGCYRGCDDPDHNGEHKSLDTIKEELKQLRAIRNCSMISISGGEPSLHPDITAIVSYVKELKMSPVLFTNGKLLTVEFLTKLKKAGLVGVVIRVDSLQNNQTQMTEKECNDIRMKFADVCNEVGLFLTLTTCIDPSNVSQVKDVINFAEENHKKVGQLIMILKRQLIFKKEDIKDDTNFVFVDDFVSLLHRDFPELEFSAYLGSTGHSQKAKWLQGFRYIQHSKTLGYSDKKIVELLQILHHFRTGQYLGILPKRKNFISFISLLFLSFFNKSIRRIFGSLLIRCLKNPLNLFRKKSVQGLTVVVPPHIVDGRRDLCDGCPDAIFHNGQLVPSCALEEIKELGRTFELK